MAHATIHMGVTIPQLLRGASRICPAHSTLTVLRHSAFCYCTANGTLKSKRKMDHLERTASNFRQEVSIACGRTASRVHPIYAELIQHTDGVTAQRQVISQAKVCGITNESDTVKRLRLAIANKDFTFKAGQCPNFYQPEKDICHQRALQLNRVDFFIPGVSVVGGFSMCSSPGLLEREGILELAVKYTAHPPAHWIHTECTVDSEVALRVGGDFFFDPQPGDSPVKLVLIAGGVGINPLFSILLHVADLHGYQERKGNEYKMGTVKLYYSAKNTKELLFKKNILGLMNAFPGKIMCHFHVTQQSSQICEELQPHVTEGRISEKDLEKHVSKDTLWYICGPPPMIESISKLLSNIGVPTNCVFFEKWW